MKKKIILFLAMFLLNCYKFPANPLEKDEDLKHQPAIVQIALDSQNNIVLYLNYGYSQESNIVVERKTIGGFNRINCVRLMNSVLIDTTFDKELDYNFSYRVMVEKNDHQTAYSEEMPFDYKSNLINSPKDLQSLTLELQGIKLEWSDRSSKEDGYKIEKNSGSGFNELASLPSNTQSYLDAINGIPSLPLQLSYRVRAFNSDLSSQCAETSISYTGIGVPTNLKITDTTAYHFTIEWQDHSNIETGYVVERSTSGVLFEEIAQLNANTTQYTDQITEIGFYSYRVRAKKDNLFSSYSNEVSYNIRCGVLVAPMNLRIIDTTAYHFTIEWDDNNSIETGYLVERNKNIGIFTEIAQLNADVTRYVDNLTETGVYSYRVRSVMGSLYSLYSNEVSKYIKIILPMKGLVAYYPFNGNANDESGNGNNGTVVGASMTNDRFDKQNSAYSFDGIDDRIEVAHNNLIQPPNQLSVCVWLYIKAFYSGSYHWSEILKKGGPWAGIGRYEIYYTDSYFGFDLQYANGTDIRLQTPATSIQINKWYFLVLTYDGQSQKGYIDTNLVVSSSVSYQLGYNTDTFVIGWNSGNSIYPYPVNGKIDDLRIYNCALSIEEIQSLYHESGWGN